MRTLLLTRLAACLLCEILFTGTQQFKAQSVSWQNFSASSLILGVNHSASKPLQYNNELDVISFVQRASPYYPTSPTPSLSAANGVIVSYISSNWGASWDSTCLWSNNLYPGRFPQGGIYNPQGNTNLSNAYVVGTGPCIDYTVFAGNWAGSKQIGSGNYNTTASNQPNAQQMLSSFPPLPSFGKCHFSRNSFSTSDDGKVRSLARLSDPLDPGGFTGAMVMEAAFSNGVFVWTGDSITCQAAYNSQYQKVVTGEPLMAWNESGTVGYVVFQGSHYGSLGSNKGIQPIVYRSMNSGGSWELMPAMDFNSAGAVYLKKYLPKVYPGNPDPNLIIPNTAVNEGWDVVVDKNNTLHVACLLNGAVTSDRDSIDYRRYYGTEGYNWNHSPGRHPYLVDFMLHQSQNWSYGIVDSLSSESPGDTPSSPGYQYNTWGFTAVTNQARLQCSRTPDGRFVIFTWAESDTTLTSSSVKWNSIPNVKARLIDTDTYSLSPSELNLSAGTNTNISGRATMHYAAPRCSSATLSATTFDVKLPVSVSNNPSFAALANCTHWFAAAQLNFSNSTIPFTHSIAVTGRGELSMNIESQFLVYPNPFGSLFKIKCQDANSGTYRIELLDISGRIIYSDHFKSQEVELNTGFCGAGVYVLKISNASGVMHKLIVKD